MDGHAREPRPAARRRLVAALVAVFALCCAAGTALAADAVQDPEQRWPADGPAVTTAVQLANERWGMAACHGDVTIVWTRLPAQINASSSWSNDVDPYTQPSKNDSCEIELSTRTDWDWPKLCSVLVHEFGHLTGHPHVDDPGDIMYAYYVRPVPECEATPEPAPAPAAPPAPPPAPALSTASAAAARPKAAHVLPRKAAARPAPKHHAHKRRTKRR